MKNINQTKKVMRHYWLYVIALEQNKYYVGITTRKDPMVRIRQHGGMLGAQWTRKYKPIRTVKPLLIRDLGVTSQYEAEKQEQAVFKEYAKLYGLSNVRGGRIVSTGFVGRIGAIYFNRQMLEAFGILILLIACGIVLLATGLGKN